QLTTLYQDQFGEKIGKLTVYRGQPMNAQELEKLKTHIVAVDFSGNDELQSMGIESVIFEIDVDLTVQRCPFARINKFSDHQDENEILFAIRSIFHIEQVELFTDDIWLVQLILTNEVKKEIEDFLAYFTQHIGNQPSILELGFFFRRLAILNEPNISISVY
ncbi:unnamed protein product, partial [Rotaria sp. Silwood1]